MVSFEKNDRIELAIYDSRLTYMVQPFVKAEIESVTFLAKIKNNPAAFTINVDGVATNLSRVDELKLCRGINSDNDLDALFTFQTLTI